MAAEGQLVVNVLRGVKRPNSFSAAIAMATEEIYKLYYTVESNGRDNKWTLNQDTVCQTAISKIKIEFSVLRRKIVVRKPQGLLTECETAVLNRSIKLCSWAIASFMVQMTDRLLTRQNKCKRRQQQKGSTVQWLDHSDALQSCQRSLLPCNL